MKKVVFILGTSRSEGNTRKLVDALNEKDDATVLDLNDYEISYFDYEHKNRDDDFVGLINEIMKYQVVVFATPVYWYSMSAQMKAFFDRTSDLLGIRKSLGKALKGRKTFLVSTGTQETLPEGFEIPFKRTSDYFDMQYRGAFYGRISEDLSLSPNLIDSARGFRGNIFD